MRRISGTHSFQNLDVENFACNVRRCSGWEEDACDSEHAVTTMLARYNKHQEILEAIGTHRLMDNPVLLVFGLEEVIVKEGRQGEFESGVVRSRARMVLSRGYSWFDLNLDQVLYESRVDRDDGDIIVSQWKCME